MKKLLMVMLFAALIKNVDAGMSDADLPLSDLLILERAAVSCAVVGVNAMLNQQEWPPQGSCIGQVSKVTTSPLTNSKKIFVINDPVINLKRKVTVNPSWPAHVRTPFDFDVNGRAEMKDDFQDEFNEKGNGIILEADPFFEGQCLMWNAPVDALGFSEKHHSGVKVLPKSWNNNIEEARQDIRLLKSRNLDELQNLCSHPNPIIRMAAFGTLLSHIGAKDFIVDIFKNGDDELETAIQVTLALMQKNKALDANLLKLADESVSAHLTNGLALGAYVALGYFDHEARRVAQEQASLIRVREPFDTAKITSAATLLLLHCYEREKNSAKPLSADTHVRAFAGALRLNELFVKLSLIAADK